MFRSSHLVVLFFLVIRVFAKPASSSVNAFVPTSAIRHSSTNSVMSTLTNRKEAGKIPSSSTSSSTVVASTTGGAAAGGAAAGNPKKRIRISAFDSMRFFLIAFIATGHFIKFAGPTPLVEKFFSQVNVVVGAFFVLSGYVTAYTSTEVGAYQASPKLSPAPAWTLSRVFGYFPMHALVLTLFAPVFMFADVKYNGWLQTAVHGFLSFSMLQAWFPMHAEVWNAPTWFLSALTFATAVLPFSLPSIAKMTKPQLRKTTTYLALLSLIPRLAYSYDLNCWGIMEGATAPKAMPNLAIFNTQRFNPFFAAIEVIMGAVACRLVMLDGVGAGEETPKTSFLSTLIPTLGLVAVLVLRAMEVLHLNDLLTRSLIFIPLFLKLLMATHRTSVAGAKDPIVGALNSKFLVFLGGLSFPIFLLHGPIGQVCYKKIVATKLFGGPLHKVIGPQAFGIYVGATLLGSFLLKKFFMDVKAVGKWSKDTSQKWASGL